MISRLFGRRPGKLQQAGRQFPSMGSEVPARAAAPKWTNVEPLDRVAQAAAVAFQLLAIREPVMDDHHRLRALQVRVTGDDMSRSRALRATKARCKFSRSASILAAASRTKSLRSVAT